MNLSKYTFIFLFALFSTTGFAQKSTSTPTPTPVEDEDDVVKISTNLIQIDMTVTDKNGNVVTDLTPDDLEIYENGKKQTMTNFSFVPLASQSQTLSQTQVGVAVKNKVSMIPPVKLKPEQIRRTYSLVIDDLGISSSNIYFVKEALKRFVNEQMQEGDLVSIFRVSGGIGALQSFTHDKRQLLATVDKIRWNVSGAPLNSIAPLTDKSLSEEIYNNGDSPAGALLSGGNIIQNEEAIAKKIQTETARQSAFAVGTIGALKYIINGMNSLPGRKSLVLFSEGFQIKDYGNFLSRNTPSVAPQITQVPFALKSLTELANRSAVTVYTIDPRGVFDMTERRGEDGGTENTDKDIKLRISLYDDTTSSLYILSRETGGTSFKGNNMNLGIKNFLEDQKGYYLVGYQPDSETFDPKKYKFNSISIKVKRPDLKVRYRSGFTGVTDEQYKPAQSIQKDLIAALTSPFGTNGINLSIYPIFVSNEKKENFIHSLINIDANDLTFVTQPNGMRKAEFRLVAMTFGENGAPLEPVYKDYTIQAHDKIYSNIMKNGFVYDMYIPIKKPGAYQFRIALRDKASSKIGSASQFIEIPNLENKNLAISTLIIKGYTAQEWKDKDLPQNIISEESAYFDSTVRKFKQGSSISYGYIIYNAKTDSDQKTQLEVQAKLFKDGKIVSESKPKPLNIGNQTNLQRIENSGILSLGNKFSTGDYVFQVVIRDKLAKESQQVASQSFDFEVTK